MGRRKNKSKGKHDNIPHYKPESWYHLMKTRPDLPRGRVDSIGGVRDIGDLTSNQTRIRSLQLLHHRSVGYQPSTTWSTSPRRLFLQANWITQARKDKHAIWNCRCVWNENQSRGSRTWFQRTNRYSGGDQEWGPWITVKGLVAIVTTNQSQFHKEN